MSNSSEKLIDAAAPTEQAEVDGLKRYGWRDEEIASMTPAQRRREFKEVVESEEFLPEQATQQAATPLGAKVTPERGSAATGQTEHLPTAGTPTEQVKNGDLKRHGWADEESPATSPKTRLQLFGGKLIYGGLTVIFLFAVFKMAFEPREQPQVIPGWDEISNCSFTVSFDGKSHLSLSENHFARIEEPGRASVDGSWSFNEGAANYTITLNNEPVSYSVVSPGDGDSCMLIRGDLMTADLPRSWFYSRAEADGRSDRDPPER